jgi:CubicO group peptidase (beta-lactamase class C family)
MNKKEKILSEQKKDRTFEKIDRKLQKIVTKSGYLRNALLLVHSDRLNIHWKFAFGLTGIDNNPIDSDSAYHIASIGKTFTSVLIARLYEREKIKYHDPIYKYLSQEFLKGLFVYQGVDYSKDVLVSQLLNHTSGVADYFEDKSLEGKSIKELVVEEPDRFWKPEETIDYSRKNQKVFSKPGKRFHYSDTGYNLLGKIIENISGKSLHENLHNEIFDPLGMKHSYFLFYSQPSEKSIHKIADVYMGENEVSSFKSISMDWAGGGIVSTTEDLLLFHQALVHNRLIKKETYELCSKDLGRFGFGMDYGYGLLFLNVGKMTVIYPTTLNMWGNFGSIAAYMFYNPSHDVYLIGSFNHSNHVRKQVIFMIDVIRKLSKVS